VWAHDIKADTWDFVVEQTGTAWVPVPDSDWTDKQRGHRVTALGYTFDIQAAPDTDLWLVAVIDGEPLDLRVARVGP